MVDAYNIAVNASAKASTTRHGYRRASHKADMPRIATYTSSAASGGRMNRGVRYPPSSPSAATAADSYRTASAMAAAAAISININATGASNRRYPYPK